ncbi:MAG: FHA domain-containing protein [Planctomycetes bacterium]|nr:FHA domain-containing protein [Planctomycetota bacterium]
MSASKDTKDPLDDVERIASALEGASTAVTAYLSVQKSCIVLSEKLEDVRVELREIGKDARPDIEAALAESSAPLKSARAALRRLRGESKEDQLNGLRQEVEARRAALEGLRDVLEPLAEATGAAEGNLSESQEMLALGRCELSEAEAEVAKNEASLKEAKTALSTARERAEDLAEVGRKARESSKAAAAKLKAGEASVEARERKVERAKEACDQAKAELKTSTEGVVAAKAEIEVAKEDVSAAKELLSEARQAQLESSQALTRVETADEEEAAEAAASEAQDQVSAAKTARNEAKEGVATKEAALAEIEGKIEGAKEALAKAETALTAAEEGAVASKAKLEVQREGAGLEEVQKATAAAHSAAEIADLSEAALLGIKSALAAAEAQVVTLQADCEELSTTSRGNEAFVASQLEDLGRAKADVDAAQRALDESDEKLKEANSALATAQGSLQQLLTALARVERERETHERLLEELIDEAASVLSPLEEEEGSDFADTGAWGSLDTLFDGPPKKPKSSDPRVSLADTDLALTPVKDDEAPRPEGGPSFRLSVSLPNRHLSDFEFAQEEVTVGRDPSCDVTLDSPVVSRVQFTIRQHEGLFALIDAGTANGTFINGKKVSGLTLLNDGDGIGLGKFRLRFMSETQVAFDLAERLEKTGGVELGGMTLQITPEESRRQDGAHDRIRGLLVLPTPDGSDPVEHPLSEVFTVGKDIACDLVLRGWFTPKRAALITRGYESYTLINVTPSGNDVSVNGEVVHGHRRLASGDRIEIYSHRFLFKVPEGAA